jgi:hypothetical protein
MTSSPRDSRERRAADWDGLMNEKEWTAIAPWFINRPELCHDLHTIVGDMSLPCRRYFLARLGEHLSSHPDRRPARQILAAIVSTYARAGHASEQRRIRVLRAIPQPQLTLP